MQFTLPVSARGLRPLSPGRETQSRERMADRQYDSLTDADLTTFVTDGYYILGAGETVDEVTTSGEWLLTDDPVEVRR